MALVNYIDKTGLRFFYRQLKRIISQSGMNVVDITAEKAIPQLTKTGALAYYIDGSKTTITEGDDCIHLPKKASKGDIFVLDYCFTESGELDSNIRFINKYVLFDETSIYMGRVTSPDGYNLTATNWILNSGAGAGVTTITSEAYDALGENVDPTVVYFITDGNGNVGKIMQNGIEYGGKPVSVEDFAIELTQEEYDALTEAERKNGKFYFCPDAPDEGHVLNTVSEITQEAYDALPEDAKNSDCTFYITNGNGSIGKIVRKGIDYSGEALKKENIYKEISYANYMALSEEERNNGLLYFCPDAPSEEKQYAVLVDISEEGYAALSEEEKNNGKFYFVYNAQVDKPHTLTGVMISQSGYDALPTSEKMSGKIFLVDDDEVILHVPEIFDVMVHKGEIASANLPTTGTLHAYYYLTDKFEGRYWNGSKWQIVR